MSTTAVGLAVSAGPGATTVSASYGGFTDATTLTVQDQLVSIAISPSTATVAAGQNQQFTATGLYASGVTENLTNSVTWSSSATSVAGISATGLATTVAAGQTTVEAGIGSVQASANLMVATPNGLGVWTTLPVTMPINPVHVALLANGQLLVIAGSGNCSPAQKGCPTGPPYGPSNGSGALLMQPGTWQVTQQFSLGWDMFCNGMVLLQDGTALIAGGTIKYDPFWGSAQAAIFDPVADTFNDIGNMAHGRWYPTLLTLSDGTVMTFSGLSETGGTNPAVEFYSQSTGWSQQYIAPWNPDTYPRLHLLPNGLVFYSSSQITSRLFNPATAAWTTLGYTNYGGIRTYGSSVLLALTPANGYDPKVMIMGGGTPSTNTTEIIDLGASTPAWQWGPNMSQPRTQMNAVILPDGTILAMGGSLNNEDTTTASLNADLYNPTTNTFSSAGANAYPRLYHSVALLLPDATVWLAGGNPVRGTFQPQMEIYRPAYLFNPDGSLATRPAITGAPTSISYGNTFTVTSPDAANISSVVLVRNGTVTHAFGMDQREVGMSFTAGNGQLTVTAPPNGDIAPPGYYMLFILNNSGVPSVATFVQVTSAAGQKKSQVAGQDVVASTGDAAQTPEAATTSSGHFANGHALPQRPLDQTSSSSVVAANSGRDIRGTWSGKFVSNEPSEVPFRMTVVIRRDAHGQLAGTSTLTSKCVQHAQLQVTVTGSEVAMSGSDELGDNVTLHGTIDKAGRLLKSTYIVDGSMTGRCETDTGTGVLTKR